MLSLAGIGLAGVTGWMGSELVERTRRRGASRSARRRAELAAAKTIDLRENPLAAATDTPPPKAGTPRWETRP
jgi:hypothetical protein